MNLTKNSSVSAASKNAASLRLSEQQAAAEIFIRALRSVHADETEETAAISLARRLTRRLDPAARKLERFLRSPATDPFRAAQAGGGPQNTTIRLSKSKHAWKNRFDLEWIEETTNGEGKLIARHSASASVVTARDARGAYVNDFECSKKKPLPLEDEPKGEALSASADSAGETLQNASQEP